MYITGMSPALWPFGGHTMAPITLQQLCGIHRVWVKAVKNTGEGRRGESREGGESVLGGWGCVGRGLQKQSQNLKTKFTTEGKQQG